MVRPAKPDEFGRILEIYAAARRYMAENGNPAQWGNAYPPRELLEGDLRRGELFVVAESGKIHGAFVLTAGEEPSYARIEGGAWKNSGPYGTIHRVAGDGAGKGVFGQCMEFCKRRMKNLRIDTHEDNRAMRRLIGKHGFAQRGVVHVEDGSPRIAYEYDGQRRKNG